MKTAKEIQNLIGIDDHETLAYGYTLNRDTVELYFENSNLVRCEFDASIDGQLLRTKRTPLFEASFFKDNIKRFYRNATHKQLIELFDTFGNPLSLT